MSEREHQTDSADDDQPLWYCPECGEPQYQAGAYCADCEQPIADDSPRGTGFYSTTPEGHTMHVNGARDMDNETLAALAQLADLAFKQYANEHR